MAVDISNLEMSGDFQEDGQIKLDFLLQRSTRLQTTLKSATAKVQESLKHATESKEPDSEQEDFYFGSPEDDHDPFFSQLSMVDQLSTERDDLKKECDKLKEAISVYSREIKKLNKILEDRTTEIESLKRAVKCSHDNPVTKHVLTVSPVPSESSSILQPATGSTSMASKVTEGKRTESRTKLSSSTSDEWSFVEDMAEKRVKPWDINAFSQGGRKLIQDSPFGVLSDGSDIVLHLVFQYLSMAELFIMRRVCKEWQRISQQPSLWKHIEISNAMLSSVTLLRMAEWCTETQVLKLHQIIPRPSQPNEDLKSYIQSQRACLEQGLAVLFQSSGHSLRTVYITDCHVMITERVLWLASMYCLNLVEFAYSSEEFPVTTEAIWCLSCGSPQIQTLAFPPSSTATLSSGKLELFDDHSLCKMAVGFPRLQLASVGGCSITPQGIAQFVTDCLYLRELRLVRCFEVNERTIRELMTSRPIRLTTISFLNTQITPRAVSLLSRIWTQLKKIKITLSYSDYFEDINDPKMRKEYKKIIERLQDLKRDSSLSRVLEVFSDYS